MKNILTALLCVIALPAFSQQSAVSAEKMNVLYIGVPNPMTIMAEGYSCDVTLPECDGCTFTHKEGCSYDIMVTRPGEVVVKVMVKNAGSVKIVGEHPFRVKYVADPIARVGGRSKGKISVSSFKSQIGVGASVASGADFDGKDKVLSYNVSVFRDTKSIYERGNMGASFNKKTKDFFQSLKPGDRVLFSEVKVIGRDSVTRIINNIDLELIQ